MIKNIYDIYKQKSSRDIEPLDKHQIVNNDQRKPRKHRNGGYKQQGICQALVLGCCPVLLL